MSKLHEGEPITTAKKTNTASTKTEPTKTETQKSISNMMSLDGMIFGMPPGTHMSDKIMFNSMPTATIIPCEPEFTLGLSLFRLDKDKGLIEYKKILESVGFTFSGDSIKVAYQADGFPTDTFNNEYGETFLDRFAQATSSGLGDLAQMAGWQNFSQATNQVKDLAGAVGYGEQAGGMMDKAGSFIDKAGSGMNADNQRMFKGAIDSMKSLVTGSRIDFPLVWKNSSFNPSYTMTIRLYNPNPSNPESTRKYIVGPIAALIALGLPKVAEDSTTYKWPLLCKVRSPGLYHLNAAYINSISVVKGGDQQSIAFNQSMAMCDVRIDFGCLYNSILAGPGTNKLGYDRPTLGSYLEAIGGTSVTGADSRRDTYKMTTEQNVLEKSNPSYANTKHSASVDDSSLGMEGQSQRVAQEDLDTENELRRASGGGDVSTAATDTTVAAA